MQGHLFWEALLSVPKESNCELGSRLLHRRQDEGEHSTKCETEQEVNSPHQYFLWILQQTTRVPESAFFSGTPCWNLTSMAFPWNLSIFESAEREALKNLTTYWAFLKFSNSLSAHVRISETICAKNARMIHFILRTCFKLNDILKAHADFSFLPCVLSWASYCFLFYCCLHTSIPY